MREHEHRVPVQVLARPSAQDRKLSPQSRPLERSQHVRRPLRSETPLRLDPRRLDLCSSLRCDVRCSIGVDEGGELVGESDGNGSRRPRPEESARDASVVVSTKSNRELGVEGSGGGCSDQGGGPRSDSKFGVDSLSALERDLLVRCWLRLHREVD